MAICSWTWPKNGDVYHVNQPPHCRLNCDDSTAMGGYFDESLINCNFRSNKRNSYWPVIVFDDFYEWEIGSRAATSCGTLSWCMLCKQFQDPGSKIPFLLGKAYLVVGSYVATISVMVSKQLSTFSKWKLPKMLKDCHRYYVPSAVWS